MNPLKIPKVKPEPFEYDAALFFLDGQYLFRWTKDDQVHSKFLNPKAVAIAFQGIDEDSGWIDPEIIRYGRDRESAWYILFKTYPKVNLQFQYDNDTFIIQTILPSLVLYYRDNRLRIFAMKEKQFKPDNMTYKAPFPNIADNAVCFGSNFSHNLTPAALWDLFLHTPFTSAGNSDKSKKYPKDVRMMYGWLRANSKVRYPLSDLICIAPFSEVIERLLP